MAGSVARDVDVYYQKRQNLQYWLLEKALGTKEDYRAVTEKSVRLTLDSSSASLRSAAQRRTRWQCMCVADSLGLVKGIAAAVRRGCKPGKLADAD